MPKVFESLIYSAIVILTAFFGVKGQDSASLTIDKCWEYQSDGLSKYEMASDNEVNLYFSNSDGSIIALDKNGKVIWTTEIGKIITSKIIYDNQKLFFTAKSLDNSTDLSLYSISSLTGITNWKKDIQFSKGADSINDISMSNGYFIVSEKDGNLVIIDSINGEIIVNKEKTMTIVSNIITRNHELIYITENKKLVSYNLSAKSQNIITALNEKFTQIDRLTDNQILLTNSLGKITALDTKSGKITWKNRVGGAVTSLSISQNDLIISSVDNYIYNISLINGKIKWRRRLENRNSSILLKKNKLIFSSIINENKTVVINQAEGKIINQISLPGENYFTGSPLIIGENVLLSSNIGISLHSVNGCKN